MLRLLAYLWAAPASLLGLGLALVAAVSGGRMRLQGGLIEASGGLPGRLLRGSRFWRGGAAMVLGHVILARDQVCLERSRAHEMTHVRQFERYGMFLLPVYVVVAWWLALRGYDPYLDHPFEREANDGQSPPRP
jgi:hypothetical protein